MTIDVLDCDSLSWTARCVAGFWTQGYSCKQIAEIMHVHRHTIERAVQALRSAGVTVGESGQTRTHDRPPSGTNMVHDMSQKSTRQVPKRDTGDFDAFWAQYPRRVGKKAARGKYLTVLKSVSHDDIMAGLERYCQHLAGNGTAPDYIAHPTTWLNQGRWDDDYKVAVKVQKAQAVCPHCGAPRTGTMSFCPECEEDF